MKSRSCGVISGLAFIRAVGDAAKVLTDDQRAALLGAKPSAGQAAQPKM